MRYFSLFAGIEAASAAWGPLGWEPLLFSEIDPFPSAVLKKRFPWVPNLGDITMIDWKGAVHDFGKPELVVGGSPCQSFSVAGGRTGLDGASGLMWEYVRCVRQVKPDWLLWENVPGALSSSHGEDFRCLLEALDALGYGLAWRVLDAQFFGVAQRRERLFLVGRLGDPTGPCEVLFEPESLQWDPQSSREKRKALADGAGRGAEAAGFKYHQGDGAGNIGYEPEQSPTLTADYHNQAVICMTDTQPNSIVGSDICGALSATMHKDPPVTLQVRCGSEGGGKGALVQTDMSATLSTVQTQTLFRPVDTEQGYEVRRLTPRECERLQGFPDDWTKVPYRGKAEEDCPDTLRYKAIGNSMAVPVMRWIGERIGTVTGKK